MMICHSDAYEIGQEFINRKNQIICVKKRFFTAEDTIEYLCVAGIMSARVSHVMVKNKLKNKDWRLKNKL